MRLKLAVKSALHAGALFVLGLLLLGIPATYFGDVLESGFISLGRSMPAIILFMAIAILMFFFGILILGVRVAQVSTMRFFALTLVGPALGVAPLALAWFRGPFDDIESLTLSWAGASVLLLALIIVPFWLAATALRKRFAQNKPINEICDRVE